MLWDFINVLGVAFKLQPLGMPLPALQNMLCCNCAVDYSLASAVHMSMMLVLARDVEVAASRLHTCAQPMHARVARGTHALHVARSCAWRVR